MPDCHAWLSRWMHKECYCGLGRFYGEDAARGLVSDMPHHPAALGVGALAAGVQQRGNGLLALKQVRQELQEQLTQLTGGWANHTAAGHIAPWVEAKAELCSVRGLDLWGAWYWIYFFAAVAGFAVPLALSGIYLRRMCRLPGGELNLPRAVQGCCLAAVALRLWFMIAQCVFVDMAPESRPTSWATATQVSYCLFFPLAATAFLCMCQLWSKYIASLDHEAPSPWHRNPFVGICSAFAGFEVLRIVSDLTGYRPVFDAIYFLWMALVSLAVAILGLRIARQLYVRLQGWYRADHEGGRLLYQKTMVSAGLVSAVALCYLGLCIIYALGGRFYAWPCLICWVISRLLEALYSLVVVLAAASRTPAAPPPHLVYTNGFGSEASTEHGSEVQVRAPSWPMCIETNGDPAPPAQRRERGSSHSLGDSFPSNGASR